MNIPIEDSSEGLLNVTLLAYSKIVKTLLKQCYLFKKKSILLKEMCILNKPQKIKVSYARLTNIVTGENLIPYE